jgi:Family of unknown function (DUF6272)
MEKQTDFFTALPGETTMLSYKGSAEDVIPDSVYTELETKLDNSEDSKSRKKRFFYVAVECLQNIIRHQESQGNGTPDKHDVLVMAFAAPGDHYRIVTGNIITAANATSLKMQLDQLKNLSAEELHTLYLNKLSDSTFSEKGGAGLGLIEIARKSENNLHYTFKEEGNNSFFSLEVTVK